MSATTTRTIKRGLAMGRRPPGRDARGRRQMKQKNKQEKKTKKDTSSSTATTSTTSASTTKGEAKLPGWMSNAETRQAYQKDKWTAIAQQAIPVLAFGMLINFSEDVNELVHAYVLPLQLGPLYGPSMVPSIHPYGDLWLVTTPMWDKLRYPYHILKSWLLGQPLRLYEAGHIIIWKDPTTGRYACKRIVGVAGDTVQRYGQFAEYFRHRADVGVQWQFLPESRGIDPTCPWDDTQKDNNEHDNDNENTGNNTIERDDIYRTLTVPEGHVWVEGDNPLMSVDSRHYGPVPVNNICGKLVWRLWPLVRHPAIRKHDQLLMRHRHIRPQPLDLETPKQRGQPDRLALYYNLHRPKQQSQQQKKEKEHMEKEPHSQPSPQL